MSVKTKAAILAEINTLWADNTSGNISAQDGRTVFTDIVDSYFDAPYLEYKATISQASTAAPTVSRLFKNTTLGVVLTRDGVGSYSVTITGTAAFADLFCAIPYIALQSDPTKTIVIAAEDDNLFTIKTYNAGVASDDILSSTPVNFLVYIP